VEKIKTILGRGKWITASRIFEYLFRETDDIAVGRVLNANSLGIYQVAYKISSLPITEVANVVTRVTFPIYVKISHDSTRLKRAFVRVLLVVFVLTVPFGIFLFIFSDPFVTILLGNSYDWSEVVPVIKVLALFGVARALTSVTYPLFNSVKKTGIHDIRNVSWRFRVSHNNTAFGKSVWNSGCRNICFDRFAGCGSNSHIFYT